MRAFLKSNYRFIICALVGIIGGFALGYAVFHQYSDENGDPVTAVGHIGQLNILPDTTIVCNYNFSACDHTVTKSIDSLPYVGQTREEFLLEFRDAEIESFSSSAVRINSMVVGPCPQHIMLRADDTGQLNVYQTSEESLEIVGIQALPMYAASFSQEVGEELYEGIVFDSIDEINAYLENAES